MAMVRPVTHDDIGLKVLRDAPADATEIIDIVAVHGIGAHPDDSWCKNIGTTESPQWINWLKEENMLPAITPNARIMRYGYDTQWYGEEAIRQKVSTVSKRLLRALKRNRKSFPFRPLLLIAHCFGGLVVLKALLNAWEEEEEWPGIFTSIIGLVFLGTPFRGADGMSQMELLTAARKQYHEDEVQSEILTVLQPGNEYLQELVDRFGKMRRKVKKAQIACFYELKLSNIGGLVGQQSYMRFAVSEASGCLELSEGVSKFSLSRTHFDMNKFGKPTEEEFETLCEVIESMVQVSQRYGSSVLPMRGSLDAQNIASSSVVSPPALSLSQNSQTLGHNTKSTTRAPASQKPKGKKKKGIKEWSSAEDTKLRIVVEGMQMLNWKRVAESFDDRSDFACQKRFEKLNQRK